MPVNIKSGESEEQFISRCIGEEVSAGKEQDQAAAICYSYWRKSNNLSAQSLVASKLRQDACKGINLLAEGLEDACWDGYEAIGTKMLDGREVPNCVPISD